jgi:hypothetical protein
MQEEISTTLATSPPSGEGLGNVTVFKYHLGITGITRKGINTQTPDSPGELAGHIALKSLCRIPMHVTPAFTSFECPVRPHT